MPPDVSIVVVARNEEKTISRCLQSLMDLEFPGERYETIVVDGASRDGTREVCRGYPVKLLALNRGGISYQRNAGVAAARGRYVAFTDADCVVDRSWLRSLVDQMAKHNGNLAAVGGPNLVFDDDPPLSKVIGYAQETLLGSGGSAQAANAKRAGYVDSIPNCNILYVKEVIAKERYDEGMSVGDDCDLNYRLRRRQYDFFYLPAAIVWHHRPRTIKQLIKKMYSYGEALGWITRKHRRVVRWYSLAAGLTVLALSISYPVLSLFPKAVYVYASLASLYTLGLAVSTAQVYRRYKAPESFLAFIVLPVQHLSYGIGFLKGLVAKRRVR